MKTRSFAIIRDGSKFLLIRESSIKFKNQWYLPGGKLNENESLSVGLLREVKEETGFEVKINGVFLIQDLYRPMAQKKLVIYCVATIVAGSLKTIADEHSMEVRWFEMNEIETLNTKGNLTEIINLYHPAMPLLPLEKVQINTV